MITQHSLLFTTEGDDELEEGPIVETVYVSEKEEEYLGQVISLFICFFPCLNGLMTL